MCLSGAGGTPVSGPRSFSDMPRAVSLLRSRRRSFLLRSNFWFNSETGKFGLFGKQSRNTDLLLTTQMHLYNVTNSKIKFCQRYKNDTKYKIIKETRSFSISFAHCMQQISLIILATGWIFLSVHDVKCSYSYKPRIEL